mgnify:CR=1 FL=1
MGHYGRLSSFDTKSGEIDLVTAADREAENAVISAIRTTYPDQNILAEESGGDGSESSGMRWVIDPLDGTTNFAHSFPVFCTSIGLQKDAVTLMGVVYNPFYDEMFFAEQGKGAFLNNRKISVSRNDTLSKSLVTTGFAYDRRERADELLVHYKNFMMRCHGVRRVGAAALDLCSVACGRVDGYWEANLKPWDTAAGWLIVEEAGGKVTDYSGNVFNIEKKEVLASNGLIHKQMSEVIKSIEIT